MKRFSNLILAVMVVLVLLISNLSTTPVQAAPLSQEDHWCGNGAESNNYGFTYDLEQPHWTVGNDLVSEATMTEVDVVLDELNADELAQTMILVLSGDQVGEPVNCAVHFLRYMRLGLPDGPHADNGFAWLFIVRDGEIEVRYGVGLGLPALTAPHLGNLKRLGVDTYAQTGSLDEAILAVVRAYDTYVRTGYTPTPAGETEPAPAPQSQSEESGSNILFWVILIIVVLILVVALIASQGGGSYSGGTPGTTYDSSPSASNYSSPSSGTSRGGSGSGNSARGG